MQSFAFIDETLDINIAQSYKLSIQLSLNGLSFCILDTVRNKFIALQHTNFKTDVIFDDYLNHLDNYLKKTDLLNKEYKTVKLIWVSNKNILIPSSLFTVDNLKKYFEFNQTINDLDEIHFTKLKYSNTHSVFTIPSQIANIFIKAYPKVSFYNQQSPAIEQALFRHHSSSIKVFVNVENDFFDLIITQNGKLLLYNNFLYKNENDMIYYIMYSFEQYNLDPGATDLFLSGIIDKSSKEYIKLKEYIRQIKFEKLSEEYSYSYTFNKTPHHYFNNLFNLSFCE